MNTTLLLSILFCVLSTGIIAFFTHLSKKKDNSRFEKNNGYRDFSYIYNNHCCWYSDYQCCQISREYGQTSKPAHFYCQDKLPVVF